MELLDQIAKGRAYRKIFFEPFGREYFLYVDAPRADEWSGEKDTLGLFCTTVALEIDNQQDPNCRGVMVAPLKDIQTVVHECSHAGFHFAIHIVYEKTKVALEEADDCFDSVEECAAHSTGVIAAQVLQSETIEEMQEALRKCAKNVDKSYFVLDKDGDYRYNPAQSKDSD